MKSITDMARPSHVIDRVEVGTLNGRGVTITPKQCRDLWDWIEEIEDELIDLRNRLGIGGMDRTDGDRWEEGPEIPKR